MKPLSGFPRAGAPRTENHYCGTCRRTRAFVDQGPRLQCPLCRRELTRVVAAPRR